MNGTDGMDELNPTSGESGGGIHLPDDVLFDVVEGVAGPAVLKIANEHLATCSTCAELVSLATAGREQVRAAGGAIDPIPPQVAAQVSAAVDAEWPRHRARMSAQRARTRPGWFSVKLALVAGVVAASLIGVVMANLNQPSSSSKMAPTGQSATSTSKAKADASGGRAAASPETSAADTASGASAAGSAGAIPGTVDENLAPASPTDDKGFSLERATPAQRAAHERPRCVISVDGSATDRQTLADAGYVGTFLPLVPSGHSGVVCLDPVAAASGGSGSAGAWSVEDVPVGAGD